MADDQEAPNEAGDDIGAADYQGNDGNDMIPTTTLPASLIDDAGNSVVEDYADDEPLPDVTVNLIINDAPNGAVTDIINAGITDELGNFVTKKPWEYSLDGYTEAITQGIYDGLESNGTDIGGKRWWGSWTWNKGLVIGFIALCVIGILLALVLIITGKKFKKNKPLTTTATTTGTTGGKKGVVTKGTSPKSEYKSVPTDV